MTGFTSKAVPEVAKDTARAFDQKVAEHIRRSKEALESKLSQPKGGRTSGADENKDEPVDPKSQKLVSELEKALAEGRVDPRSALGQKCAAETKKDDDFKKLGHKAKEAFRLEWAAKKLQTLRTEKTHSQSFSVVDTNLGTYLPPRRITMEEGDDHEAAEAMLRYIDKCCRMGGKWCSFNVMIERWEFLYMKRMHQEKFQQSWGLYQTMFEETDIGEQKQGALVKHATPPKKGKATDNDEGAKKKERGAAEKMMSDTIKLKAMYNRLTSHSQELVKAIGTDSESWAWANNEANLGVLKKAMAEVDEHIGADMRQILTREPRELRRELGDPMFMQACTNFLKLDAPLRDLQTKVEKLIKMRKAFKE